MSRHILSVTALLIVFLSPVSAQKSQVGVKLTVSADASIKNGIDSYIRRELRSLGDVDLYSAKPDFDISLVAIDPSNVVVISALVLRNYDFTYYMNRELQPTTLSAKAQGEMVALLAKSQTVQQHFVVSDGASRLEQLCRQTVAKIDSGSFEEQRKLDRYLNTDTPKNSASNEPSSPVFQETYVGGNGPPKLTVKNTADRTMYLKFGGANFTVLSNTSQTIDLRDAGFYDFEASADRVIPLKGQREFKRGYVYTWTFYIERSR